MLPISSGSDRTHPLAVSSGAEASKSTDSDRAARATDHHRERIDVVGPVTRAMSPCPHPRSPRAEPAAPASPRPRLEGNSQPASPTASSVEEYDSESEPFILPSTREEAERLAASRAPRLGFPQSFKDERPDLLEIFLDADYQEIPAPKDWVHLIHKDAFFSIFYPHLYPYYSLTRLRGNDS